MKIFKSKSKPKGIQKTNAKKASGNTYIPLIVLFLLGFIVYYKTKNVQAFLLLADFGLFLFIYIFLDSSSRKEKKGKAGLQTYKDFYERFFLYSGLENSYLLGFRKAVDTSPISLLRDSLKDYIDNDRKGNLPLQVKNSQSELNLIRARKERLRDDFEYTYPDSKERQLLCAIVFREKDPITIPCFVPTILIFILCIGCLFYVFLLPN